MKNCEEYRQLISCFVDEVLSVQDASRLSEHLKQCPECTAYLRYLGDFAEIIPGGLMQDPPPELHTNVMEAIKRLPIPGSVPETAADVPDSDPSSGAARHLPPEGKAAAEPVPAKKKRAKLIPMMAGVAAAACLALVLFVYPGVLRGAKNSADATNGVTMYSPPPEQSGTATGGAMASSQANGNSKGADSGDAMDPPGSANTNNAAPPTAANNANGFGDHSEDNVGASDGAAPSGEYAGGESSQDANPTGGGSNSMGGSRSAGPYGGEDPSDAPGEAAGSSNGSVSNGSGGGASNCEQEEPTATGSDTPTAPADSEGPRTDDPDRFDAVLPWHGALDENLKKLLADYLPEKGEDGVTRYYLPTKELLTLWDQTEVAYGIQVDPAYQAGDRYTGWSVVEVYPE